MATEKPDHITITLQAERTRNIRERYPVFETNYRITATEAEVIIERDLAIRRQASANPNDELPRSIEEIVKELSGLDYNCAKKHLRHTRYVKVSGRGDADEVSILDVTASGEGEDPTETWAAHISVRQALAQLTSKDRAVLIGVHMFGMTRTEVGEHMGVSQPAITKRLKKAEDKLRELLGGEGL